LARRQSARPQRKIPPAEFLSGNRSGGAVPGTSRQVGRLKLHAGTALWSRGGERKSGFEVSVPGFNHTRGALQTPSLGCPWVPWVPALFDAQRSQGVDSQGPARGDVAGHECSRGQSLDEEECTERFAAAGRFGSGTRMTKFLRVPCRLGLRNF